jgi:hypothetical protein
MDITSISTVLAQNNLQQSVGISVLNNAKNQEVQEGQDIVKMMEQSVQPNLGGNLNIRV